MEDGEEALGFFDPSFLYLGQGRLFGVIPIPVIVMLVIALLVYIVLDHTRWGSSDVRYWWKPRSHAIGWSTCEFIPDHGLRDQRNDCFDWWVLLVARVGVGDITSGTGLLLDAVEGLP